MTIPTEASVAMTRDRLKGNGSDKSEWVTSFGYQLKVLLQRQSKQSRGEVRSHERQSDQDLLVQGGAGEREREGSVIWVFSWVRFRFFFVLAVSNLFEVGQ